MDESLLIITSFFVPPGTTSLPEHIRKAFEAHAASTLVSEVHILSEADNALVSGLVSELDGSGKFTIFKQDRRPSFADLFDHASSRIESSGQTAAIMNSDISFAGDEDIRRCLASISELARTCATPVYALTRHDGIDSEWKITLSEECGLPNMLSSDCWLMSSPVRLPAADSYSLGQMNCDLMVNYDLIRAGYMLFNPCLDVCMRHHEMDAKTNAYYVEHSQTSDTQNRLWNFVMSRGNPSYECYGIPRVASRWLTSGYRPQPCSNRSKKLFVNIPPGDDSSLLTTLVELEDFANRQGFDLILLAGGDPDTLFTTCMPLTGQNKRIYFMTLDRTFGSFVESLLADGYDNRPRIVFASAMRFLSAELASLSDFIVLDLTTQLGTNLPALPQRISTTPAEALAVRYPFLTQPADGGHGGESTDGRKCTLVTSVFKSDLFLDSFIANSKSLANYQKEVDHVFLVSGTSALERSQLTTHLTSSDNVLLVWNQYDPGLYACWNIGITLARTPYISNANVDDLRATNQVSELVGVLENNPHVGVAAAAIVPFETYVGETSAIETAGAWYSDKGGEFGYTDLAILTKEDGSGYRLEPHNLPHCMPVWRRTLHDQYGYFDEKRFGTFADWAFWLECSRHGMIGYLHPEPLSYYFVNPDSHNRRGGELEELHRRVEAEHLDGFMRRTSVFQSKCTPAGIIPPHAPASGHEVERKLNLSISDAFYGQHRNPFNSLIESLRPLHHGEGGIRFLPFIERYFVWGEMDGEALSKNPQPIDSDWIGILHVPFDSPYWFEQSMRPETLFTTELWKRSLPSCRGIVCLSKDMIVDLRAHYPELPSLALKHPTDLKARHFDFGAYRKKPRVVQIGDWLRQLQAIYRIQAPGHEKWMLKKHWTKDFLQREIDALGSHVNDTVIEKDFVSNELYDDILSSSVVLCLLYASAANNVVLECIARNTPIIINPLPSVVEYLGEDYPLYATSIGQADLLLSDPKRIEQASLALARRKQTIDFSYDAFYSGMAGSSFYSDL